MVVGSFLNTFKKLHQPKSASKPQASPTGLISMSQPTTTITTTMHSDLARAFHANADKSMHAAAAEAAVAAAGGGPSHAATDGAISSNSDSSKVRTNTSALLLLLLLNPSHASPPRIVARLHWRCRPTKSENRSHHAVSSCPLVYIYFFSFRKEQKKEAIRGLSQLASKRREEKRSEAK
jgi:hypothetical protein